MVQVAVAWLQPGYVCSYQRLVTSMNLTPPLQALNEYSDHEVHVYEAEDRAGGHANTVTFTSPTTGETTPVDMYVLPIVVVLHLLLITI